MEILKENMYISTKLKKHERILFKIFNSTFMKVYNIGRIQGVNKFVE